MSYCQGVVKNVLQIIPLSPAVSVSLLIYYPVLHFQPSPYESLVYYYGIYSSSHRGKERRENRCNQSIERYRIQETKGAGKASSTWARLIHCIFEVNPLRCIKCGGNMRVIAFITDYQTTKSILKHIGEETIRPPPLRVQIPTANIPDTAIWDSIPPVEAYFHDPEYAN